MDNPNWTKGVELCNRTACQTSHRVSYYNKTMQAWYCVKCARLINDASRDKPLCVLDADRQLYEKEYKHQDNITWAQFKKGAEVFTF